MIPGRGDEVSGAATGASHSVAVRKACGPRLCPPGTRRSAPSHFTPATGSRVERRIYPRASRPGGCRMNPAFL